MTIIAKGSRVRVNLIESKILPPCIFILAPQAAKPITNIVLSGHGFLTTPAKLLRLNQHLTRLTNIPVACRNFPGGWPPQIFFAAFAALGSDHRITALIRLEHYRTM